MKKKTSVLAACFVAAAFGAANGVPPPVIAAPQTGGGQAVFALNGADILASTGVKVLQTGRADGVPAISMSGYISVWSQECAGQKCSQPAPLVRNRPLVLELAPPQVPGQADWRTLKEDFELEGGAGLSVTMQFYSVCPYPAAGAEGGRCAAPYFQAQAVLSGAAQSFCAAAMNEKDFVPFPVLMCGGAISSGKRFGITIHRDKF
jgi:hypothetical protein